MATDYQMRTYRRDESVVFLKVNEEFGGLSNMSAYMLRIPVQNSNTGVTVLTTEALYQACRYPHMPDLQRTIIEQKSPMAAKMKSKPHRAGDSRADWDQVRVKIMRWCLRVKLATHWNDFSRLLLATRDKPIVEQSAKDDFWGAKVVDGATLKGMNVLGHGAEGRGQGSEPAGQYRRATARRAAGDRELPSLWTAHFRGRPASEKDRRRCLIFAPAVERSLR